MYKTVMKYFYIHKFSFKNVNFVDHRVKNVPEKSAKTANTESRLQKRVASKCKFFCQSNVLLFVGGNW